MRISYTLGIAVAAGLLLMAAINLHAQMVDQDTVSVTATVAQDNIIIFSGDACPSCQVFLLMEGSVVDSTTSQGDGSFQLDVEDVEPITHQFGVYAFDQDGIRSGTSTFSVDVSQGAIIYVSDILVSPTLKVSDSETEQGTDVVLSGYTVPNGEVTIEIDGGSMVIQTDSAADGEFYYSLDSSNLQLGSHWAIALVETATDISGYSETVNFDIVEVVEEVVEEEADEETDEEAEKTKTSTVESPQLTIEQQIEQLEQMPPTGKAVDFAVIVANENAQVSSGEFLEMRIVIINVADEFKGKRGELLISISDSSNEELYHETYGMILEEGQRLTKKVKISCPSKQGEFVIRAEIAIEGQRINEEASAYVSWGNDCAPLRTGLETNLISPGFGFISLCEYMDWLIALLVILLIFILVLLYVIFRRKKDDEMVNKDKDKSNEDPMKGEDPAQDG